jgi:hypothetical protein
MPLTVINLKLTEARLFLVPIFHKNTVHPVPYTGTRYRYFFINGVPDSVTESNKQSELALISNSSSWKVHHLQALKLGQFLKVYNFSSSVY